MKEFAKRWLPVIVWMGVIFIGSSIGDVPRVGGKTTDSLVHRAAHVLEFAVLGVLLLRAQSKDGPITKRATINTLIVVAVYGASDEFHQRFTPGRSSEGVSVMLDVVGGAIGAGVWRWWRSSRKPRPERVVAGHAESTKEATADSTAD
ncbi:MAG: VanZ family protein [Chloroflexi bacterium]|nr:VanZ family protein [Chloroflexota bacterium]